MSNPLDTNRIKKKLCACGPK